MPAPTNLVIVMADEFDRTHLGCHGNTAVRTPHIDRLAARGTRFTDAYCNSPICVPSRASFATGLPVHELGTWDNAHPYDGRVPGWAHRVAAAGRQAVSIGKLHYRSGNDPNGFTREIMPMHVVGGVGDLLGALRDAPMERGGSRKLSQEVGRGDTSYSDYDRRITAAACDWIAANRDDPAPWVLFVSLVCPHMPFKAPAEFYDLYDEAEAALPPLGAARREAMHPWLRGLTGCLAYNDYFDERSARQAITAYRALCTFVDHNVGQVAGALERAGIAGRTRVIFTSDHGETLGRRGIWGKSNFLEWSVAVPLIMAGPEVPAGRVCRTPVSLLDVHPTVLDCGGLPPDVPHRPGRSLIGLAATEEPERAVLAQYHAVGAMAAAYMLRRGRWKYLHYVGMPPQLFDLAADPEEARDLAADPAAAGVLREMEAALRAELDPEAVDRRARADQAATIAAHGGAAAVKARGDFHYSPVPGQQAVFG